MKKRVIVWTRSPITPTVVTGRQRPPTPKERVEAKVRELWGPDVKVEFTTERVKGDKHAARLHLPNGVFVVRVSVNGEQKAEAWHLNWRTAYRGLQGKLEQVFEKEISGLA